ncbi:MAG: glutamate-5-semialdehyde dehydrogenase [Euryarchaeota archaeon]|jgi:glutamate-5-semialdehyde dehydrogenase|nr:glutamate-5-semialdehyde dehydrogenase [Euryarchaeota archaeon]
MADIITQIRDAKRAALELAVAETSVKDRALELMADALDAHRDAILAANAEDMIAAEDMMARGEITGSMVKRLKVDDDKISGMIDGVRDVRGLDDPVGETMSSLELDDGLMLYQVRCPIGLIGTIFESRPDVVPQILALSLKSGNAVAFKGGSEAHNSIRVLFDVLTEAAAAAGIPREAFVLMESREDIASILSLDGFIDLLIPRGSNEFVSYIQNNTRIPVLGHASGICHVYVDAYADIDLALAVALDSKIQYTAVCNAAETLLVDAAIADAFLPRMAALFAENGVEMRVDERAAGILEGFAVVPAAEEDWDAEYGDLVIAIKVVDSPEEAMDFINAHGSHHTDAIITADRDRQAAFAKRVDSADVFINASTRFADGYRFGKGAEVGISTNKIHTRGPVGMEGLMIYKYILVGTGQVVKDYVGRDARRFKHTPSDRDFGL